MLHARIEMLKTYLMNIPPSYLTTPVTTTVKIEPSDSSNHQHSEINYPILRSIQALLRRLPLLIPADQAEFEHDRLVERSDVSLVDLLGHLTKSLRDTREVGRKFGVVEQAKMGKKASATINDDFVMPSGKVDLAIWT